MKNSLEKTEKLSVKLWHNKQDKAMIEQARKELKEVLDEIETDELF